MFLASPVPKAYDVAKSMAYFTFHEQILLLDGIGFALSNLVRNCVDSTVIVDLCAYKNKMLRFFRVWSGRGVTACAAKSRDSFISA